MLSSKWISLLISVRSHQEAVLAINSGADIIDAKEPIAGALGILPLHKIREIISVSRRIKSNLKITGTYGDNVKRMINFNTRKFTSYCSVGLDAIKIGFDGRGVAKSREAFVELLIAYEKIIKNNRKYEPQKKIAKLVPVLMIDNGLDIDFIDFMMKTKTSENFFGVMLDTKFKDKDKNNIFNIFSTSELKNIFKKCNLYNLHYGVAGSLSLTHSKKIKEIRPFWAGYRSAICNGNRNNNLSSKKIQIIRDSLKIN